MRRALKITGWSLASLLALILVLSGALRVFGNTDSGRRWIENFTAGVTAGQVRLSGLGGSFPSHLELEQLQLSDANGPWLTAEHLSLQWSPLSLLVHHVRIDSLEIQRLAITRAPVSGQNEKAKSASSVPHADLGHLGIRELQLGAALAGTDVSLTVSADAHLRSLDEAAANVTARRTDGPGDYQLTLKFDAQRMDAQLRLHEPASGPLENILKFPGMGDLSVLATLAGARNAEVINLTLDAGALHGTLQGRVDLPARAADLSYALNAPAMTPAPGLAWDRISLQGVWHGPLTAPDASGTLEARSLQIPGGTKLGTLDAQLKAAKGLLSAHATLDQLLIPGPNPDLLRGSALTLDTSVQMSDANRPLQLSATHHLFTLHANARTAGKQSATLELMLPDLTPLAAMGHQDITGNASIHGDIAYDGKSIRLVTDTRSQIGGTASWVNLLRGQSRLQASGEISDRAFTLDKLLLDGDALSATVTGTASRGANQQLSARVTLALSDLTRLASGTAGTLRMKGRLDGPVNDLSVAADIDSKLSVHGSPPGELTASINADGIPHAPRGTMELQGDLADSPLHVDVSVEQGKARNTFQAIIHRADWKSAHAEGEVSGSEDPWQTHGQVALRINQLSDLNPLLGTALEGSIDATLALRPAGKQTSADIHLDAKQVGSGQLLANAQVTGSGTPDALHLTIAAQTSAMAGKPASIATTSVLNLSARTLQVAAAEISAYGQQLKLAAPMTLSFADGLTLTATRLQAQGASLEMQGRVTPALDLRASLHDVDPAFINTLVPQLLVAGKIDGNATLSGSFSQPRGEIHLQAIGMRSGNGIANGLPAVDVHADAQLAGDSAQVNATLAAGPKSQLTLNGQLPLARAGAVDTKLSGALNMSLLNPLLEAKGRHVEGQLTLDTTVNGTATDPQIRGTVRLAQGSFRDYTQGINLADISANIEGTEKALRILNLTARAAPGTVSATGTINILDHGIPIDLQFSARNARPVTTSILTADVDSDIHVYGKAREQLTVDGTIRVNRANVGIPSSFPPDVAILDVRRPGQAARPPGGKPLSIQLNVRVQAPRQILVRGRGLDAELGGELRISGTAEAPQVSGGFDLQRGTFDIASNRLEFSHGSVTFNGAGLKHRLDPTLDFTAQASLSDTTATVRITGFADAPKIELSSSPDMPPDEILARLLFGQSAAQLTALQVVQIGTALAKLSGGGSGKLDPLGAIQRTLGLDRLSVSGGGSASGGSTTNPSQEAGATVEAGKYLSSRIFVAVKESTTGSSQIAVDVDLTRHLKLQSRLGNGAATAQGTTPENDPGSSVGLAYTFEY